MPALVVALLMLLTPLGQRSGNLLFDIRAAEKLVFGKGQTSGENYYDVAITRQPTSGVLIKLDYSNRDTKFSFDLHHRLSLSPDFVFPAEVMTTVEVMSGGTTSMGVFTISDRVESGVAFGEVINKVSTADVDRYVTPVGRKTITLNTIAGSQSISIVGQSVVVTRGTRTTRIETPGQRVAVVSNFKFVESRLGTPLSID